MSISRRHFFTRLFSGIFFVPFNVRSEMSIDQNGSGTTGAGVSNPDTAVLMAVGDIMMHKGNILGGYDPDTGSYNFSHYFEYVKPVLTKADWVIGNLETCLAGKDAKLYLGNNEWEKGYTAWPFFNAPEVLATNLKDAGFTIISTANNHSLDRGVDGIITTNDNLDSAGLMHTGTFSSHGDRNTLRLSQKKGITMAFFAYSYSTNGIRIPERSEFMIDLIDMEQIGQDFEKAREAGAGCITCYLHYGSEYRRTPDDFQLATADKVLALGADIILGSHPHVVQPYKIVAENNGRKKVIAYSLGNFISNMKRGCEDIGVILSIGLKWKKSCINCRISDINTLLTRVYKYYSGNRLAYRIIPIKNMLENRSKYTVSDSFYNDTEKKYEIMNRHILSMLDN